MMYTKVVSDVYFVYRNVMDAYTQKHGKSVSKNIYIYVPILSFSE